MSGWCCRNPAYIEEEAFSAPCSPTWISDEHLPPPCPDERLSALDGSTPTAAGSGEHEFVPDQDLRVFRHALGQFATGVTVVTAAGRDGPVGITANSFASVSLEPPLVLWSPAKASRRFAPFTAATDFAIHVLAADQRALSEAFTWSATAFDNADWQPDAQGVPLIAGAAARFRCVTHAVHDAGDHAIILGRVLTVLRGDRAPLVFHAGRYGAFAPLD